MAIWIHHSVSTFFGESLRSSTTIQILDTFTSLDKELVQHFLFCTNLSVTYFWHRHWYTLMIANHTSLLTPLFRNRFEIIFYLRLFILIRDIFVNIPGQYSSNIRILSSKHLPPTIETLEKMFTNLTLKTPEKRDWRLCGALIVKFKFISHQFLVFLLLLWAGSFCWVHDWLNL